MAQAFSFVAMILKRMAMSENIVTANWQHVEFTTLCTEISNNHNAVVATVEHLMSALAGLQIDNALISIDGAEMPIMDGSADDFVFLIQSAGIKLQPSPRQFIKVLKPVEVCYGTARAALKPTDEWHFRLKMRVNFPDTAIGEQEFTYILGKNYEEEIARARTYGFVNDLNVLRENGLAKGASLENAIAVDGEHILNKSGLRYENEFARHKILDAIGDLYLAGKPLIADFEGDCSGHKLNNELLRALFADDDNWQIATYPE